MSPEVALIPFSRRGSGGAAVQKQAAAPDAAMHEIYDYHSVCLRQRTMITA
jgi:hypothetical protein